MGKMFDFTVYRKESCLQDQKFLTIMLVVNP